MKNERTVRYTLDNLPAGRIDRSRVHGISEDEIQRIALSDPDNPPATEEELASGELVFPSDRRKIPTYIRFDPEILEYFKRQGPGYQTRINAVLLSYVRRRQQPGKPSPSREPTRGSSPQRVRFTRSGAQLRTRLPRPFRSYGH